MFCRKNLVPFWSLFLLFSHPAFADHRIIPAVKVSSCAHLFSAGKAPAPRRIESQERLRFMEINFQDLVNYVPYINHEGRVLRRGKPAWKMEVIADAIRQENPDFIVGLEIDGYDTARDYSRDFLDNQYRPITINGNDHHNIVFFVKRDLEIDITLESRKGDTFERLPEIPRRPLFTRDLPALVVRPRGAGPESQPLFILLGTHYKSQRNSNHMDPNELRAIQVRRSLEIVQEYRNRYGEDIPIILGGDFNESLFGGRTVGALSGSLIDAFNIAPQSPPLSQRTTQIFFPDSANKAPSFSWFDSFMVNPAFALYVNRAAVLAYQNALGQRLPLTENYYDFEAEYPSDHLPVVMEVDFGSYYRDLPPQ